ncbi:hypothetical protein FB451DRAFT_1508457 [Mycena latifolia]|nr:hypothetical protein FB451DRAFT_1508457 [Mycena latifolia]
MGLQEGPERPKWQSEKGIVGRPMKNGKRTPDTSVTSDICGPAQAGAPKHQKTLGSWAGPSFSPMGTPHKTEPPWVFYSSGPIYPNLVLGGGAQTYDLVWPSVRCGRSPASAASSNKLAAVRRRNPRRSREEERHSGRSSLEDMSGIQLARLLQGLYMGSHGDATIVMRPTTSSRSWYPASVQDRRVEGDAASSCEAPRDTPLRLRVG